MKNETPGGAPRAEASSEYLTVLTSEYGALQAARSGTVFESGARITGFLATLSSFVVALAFIGQVSRLGRPFFLFAFVLLPTLFFLGLVTYVRILQSGLEDLLVTRGMARIRAALAELAPEARKYFVLSTHDDVAGHVRSMGIDPGRRQLLFTAASMVAVLNSLVIGVFVALLSVAALGLGVEISALVGGGAGLVSASLFMGHEAAQWRHAEATPEPMFPSEDILERGRRPRPWRNSR